MTFKQLMNNIEASEKDIIQKVKAIRVLAKNHCFEEAEVMAVRLRGKTESLDRLFDGFDFETAEFE